MELRHLRYFLAVAEEGGFTRAAARLFVAQSALSRQIRDLERHVGCPLFARSSRGAELTEAGRELYPRARRIVDEFDRCMAELRAESRGVVGHVRLGLNTDLAPRLGRLLSRLRVAAPAVRVEPVYYGCSGGARLLEEGTVDAVVTWWGTPGPGDRAAELFREELHVVVPAAHALAQLPAVAVDALGSGPVALFDPALGRQAWNALAALVRGRLHDPELVSAPMDPRTGVQPQMIALARRRGIATVASSPGVDLLRRAGMVARPVELPAAPVALLWSDAAPDPVHVVAEAVRTLAAVA